MTIGAEYRDHVHAQYYHCEHGKTQRRIKRGDVVATDTISNATVLTVGRHKILIQYPILHRGVLVQMVRWAQPCNLAFVSEAPIL